MNRRDIANCVSDLLGRFEAKTGERCFSEEGGSWRRLTGIANLLGLTIHDDPTLDETTLGELDRSLGRINVRPGLEPALRAFTVAHEIGHAEIHPLPVASDDESTINEEPVLSSAEEGVFQAYDPASRQELEANVFAAELLAPAEVIRQRVASDEQWNVAEMASYFGISRSAMVSQISAAVLHGSWDSPAQPEAKRIFSLDPQQTQAVDAKTPALVLAGPGAGKTRILVERFVSLVNRGEAPERILALTFANKAAGEMVERVSKALPNASQGLAVSTFHSFGLELLKLYGEQLGFLKQPTLLPPAEVFALLRDTLGRIPMGGFENLPYPTRNLKLLMSAVSRAKDELVSPTQFRELAVRWQDEVQRDPDSTAQDHKDAGFALDAAAFYAAYEEVLRNAGAADFGDLIRFAAQLLEHPNAGAQIRGKYDHLLVDETQDINYATAQMLKLIDGGRGIIWAVGDPRQSIYRFRGASSVNLLRFRQDYTNASIVDLDRNYRSVGDLVSFSQAFQIPKRQAGDDLPVPSLKSGREEAKIGDAIVLAEAPDEPSELSWISTEVVRLRDQGEPLDSMAVLCRTRAQAQKVSEALGAARIPNSWAGSLDKREAFKEIMGALYAASDDMLALTRLWTGSQEDLRILMSARRQLKTNSLSHMLFEATDSKIEGISAQGVMECGTLKKLVGTLGSFDTASQVVERFIFDLSPWTRSLIARAPLSSASARATLGETLALAKAFSKRRQDQQRSAKQFVRFLKTAQEMGELRESRSERQPGVVQIMTMHASKGLEWPTVFLPYTSKTKMPPTRGQRERVPLPKGLINGEDPNDEAIEQACLFYVALTRARDRLFVSCASKYGKFNAGLSEYADQILTTLGNSQSLLRVQAPPVPDTLMTVSPTLGFAFDGPIPYTALKTVEDCPKQFEYRYVLNLHDEEQGYLHFHQSVYQTLEWMIGEAFKGRNVSEAEALAKQAEIWTENEPNGHWYEERFIDQAAYVVKRFAEASQEGRLPAGRSICTATFGGHSVQVSIDEVEQGPTGPVFKKHKYGQPANSHAEDEVQGLMLLCARQMTGGGPPTTRVRYPLRQEERDAPFTDRKLKNLVDRLERRIQLAQSGPYEAKPNMMRCKSCLASLVCSSNPEDEED